MYCKVKVAIYSYFFQAILTVASTADFRGKFVLVKNGAQQVVKNGSFQVFTTTRRSSHLIAGGIIKILGGTLGFSLPCCAIPSQHG